MPRRFDLVPLLISLVVLAPLGFAQAAGPAPTTLYVGGHVLAADGAWRQAMAVRDGTIVALGSEPQVRRALQGTYQTRSLGGHYLIPGFIDAHIHPMFGAIFQESGIRLSDEAGHFLDDPRAVAAAVRHYIATTALNPDAWVVGYGWSPGLAEAPAFDRQLLDSVSGGHPVYLLSLDAHLALVNTAGLSRLGPISYPPGSGAIPLGADQKPRGLLLETPQFIASLRVISQIPFAFRARAFENFQVRALQDGLTTIGDILSDRDGLAFYLRPAREHRLLLRVAVSPYGPLRQRREMQHLLEGSPLLRVMLGPDKYLLDGTPGNHNAAWFQPYSDRPLALGGTSGMLTLSPDALATIVRTAVRNHTPLALHAAGDLSVHEALDAVALAPANGTLRMRIEHFDNLTAEDQKRLEVLARHGLVASIQPTHFAPVYATALPGLLGADRMHREYPLARILHAGVPVALNSDWPAALTFDPLQNLQAAEEHGAESLTPREALRAATYGDAYALGREASLGSLAVGHRADFVLLDGDPTQLHPERLHVLATFINGQQVAGASSR